MFIDYDYPGADGLMASRDFPLPALPRADVKEQVVLCGTPSGRREATVGGTADRRE